MKIRKSILDVAEKLEVSLNRTQAQIGYHRFTENETVKPVRIQRSRQHKMVSPNGLPIVCVTRGTRWGNYSGTVEEFEAEKLMQQRQEPKWFEEFYLKPLRGKNLACWCPLGDDVKCHANFWLRIANKVKE
jgi:hypothetical protein